MNISNQNNKHVRSFPESFSKTVYQTNREKQQIISQETAIKMTIYFVQLPIGLKTVSTSIRKKN